MSVKPQLLLQRVDELTAAARALEAAPTVKGFLDVVERMVVVRRWAADLHERFTAKGASYESCEEMKQGIDGLDELERELEFFGRLHFLEADGEA